MWVEIMPGVWAWVPKDAPQPQPQQGGKVMSEHSVYEATRKQVRGMEAERDAHLLQITGLVEERDALKAENAELRAELAQALDTARQWRRAYSGEIDAAGLSY